MYVTHMVTIIYGQNESHVGTFEIILISIIHSFKDHFFFFITTPKPWLYLSF